MGKIGYIRVSTEHQETARQEALMKQYQVERVFAEKMSGKNANRPELKAMLEYVRDGDTLYIESISRLGRSTRDLLNIIDVLQKKGVTLVSSKENIDTNTPQGRFVLSIFAALSELEREQTLQRQREGIAIAKSQGKYKGRQPLPIDWVKFGQLYPAFTSASTTESNGSPPIYPFIADFENVMLSGDATLPFNNFKTKNGLALKSSPLTEPFSKYPSI